MEEKDDLRDYIREQKALCTQEQLTDMSEAVVGSILFGGQWSVASTILLYSPVPDEVDIRPLIKMARQAGHRVLLPVVVGRELELRLYEGEESMRVGAYKIMEPVGPLFPLEDYDQVELAIVPGMAFDAMGNRLGRGKGYYDRLLPLLSHAYKIGVCYPFQFVADVPSQEHDVRMNEVICG